MARPAENALWGSGLSGSLLVSRGGSFLASADFAGGLLSKVQQDREQLRTEALASLGEEGSRLEFGGVGDNGLGTFERSLWQALRIVATTDSRATLR